MLVANSINCLDCIKGIYIQLPRNTPSVDLICSNCGDEAQVKTATSKSGEVPKYILGGAWEPQRKRLCAGRPPRLFVVVIAPDKPTSVFTVASEAQKEEWFQIRKPLSEKAKSPGWIGFVIRLDVMGAHLKHVGYFSLELKY
jgi:hypothetical protein